MSLAEFSQRKESQVRGSRAPRFLPRVALATLLAFTACTPSRYETPTATTTQAPKEPPQFGPVMARMNTTMERGTTRAFPAGCVISGTVYVEGQTLNDNLQSSGGLVVLESPANINAPFGATADCAYDNSPKGEIDQKVIEMLRFGCTNGCPNVFITRWKDEKLNTVGKITRGSDNSLTVLVSASLGFNSDRFLSSFEKTFPSKRPTRSVGTPL